MKNRWGQIGAVLFMSSSAIASEGMLALAAYECHSVSINQEISKICAAQSPDQAKRSESAYAKWFARNVEKAKAAADACSTQLTMLAKSDADRKDVTEIRKKIDNTKDAIIEEFRGQVASKGSIACNEFLSQLETGCCAVDIKSPHL